MDIRSLMDTALRLDASDLHLSTGLPPMLRVNGDVVAIPDWTDGPLSAAATTEAIRSVLDERRRAEWETRTEYDFSVSVPELGRFRGNAYRMQRGPGLALRVIPSKIRTLED